MAIYSAYVLYSDDDVVRPEICVHMGIALQCHCTIIIINIHIYAMMRRCVCGTSERTNNNRNRMLKVGVLFAWCALGV